MGSPDLYAILGVPPTADPAEIKRAYDFLAKAFHPDRFFDPVLKARAEDQFKALREAYEVLSDAERRRAYDEQLRARFLPPAPDPLNRILEALSLLLVGSLAGLGAAVYHGVREELRRQRRAEAPKSKRSRRRQ